MRISEIPSPIVRLDISGCPHHPILVKIEDLVNQSEQLSAESNTISSTTLSSDLSRCLSQLSSSSSAFSESTRLGIWKLSYRLWNACVDVSNATSFKSLSKRDDKAVEDNAKLRHVAAELLRVAGDVAGISSPKIKSASFYYKTGQLWYDVTKLDLASECFEKAADMVSQIEINEIADNGDRRLLLELNLSRSRTSWDLSDHNLAINLLGRCRSLLFGCTEHYKSLASQYLSFGKIILTGNDVNGSLKLMNEGLGLCDKGLTVSRTSAEAAELKALRSKCLRFIAAANLQCEEFETVLKCVKILREETGDKHPCLSVLAMKAWLGMAKHGEAETELKGMAVNKGVPEGVWISAVEAYFNAAGSAAAETVKGLFLGLLERCQLSARTTFRLARIITGEEKNDGGGRRRRLNILKDLVSDEKVLSLFSGPTPDKERAAMHALLWNSAADLFRARDYAASAEMFEKAMLYINDGGGGDDDDGRVSRAKGFRVLCLCHLAVSELDRAEEYVDAAEKLEPNVTTRFLKFKILLQKNDGDGAISQMNAMQSCVDFTVDFLSLAAHEAVACSALPVAVASLVHLLGFYSGGQTLPAAEAVVVRTLITVLSRISGSEEDVLKHARRMLRRLGGGEDARRERNWFAVTCWNNGARAAGERRYELCSQFLRLSSEFYGGDEPMSCKSAILSVSAMIAWEKQRGTPLSADEVKGAMESIDAVGKILVTSRTAAAATTTPSSAVDLFYLYTFHKFNLCGRVDELVPQQVVLIRSFASAAAAAGGDRAGELLEIGLVASRGGRPNLEAATVALNASLSSFLSSASPDYASAAVAFRKLIEISSIQMGSATGDDGVGCAAFEVYKQASRVMVGLKGGEYPVEEGKWLAVTAWNRAALPLRLGRVKASQSWMEMGADIAAKVAGMDGYTACMHDFLRSFRGTTSASTSD